MCYNILGDEIMTRTDQKAIEIEKRILVVEVVEYLSKKYCVPSATILKKLQSRHLYKLINDSTKRYHKAKISFVLRLLDDELKENKLTIEQWVLRNEI